MKSPRLCNDLALAYFANDIRVLLSGHSNVTTFERDAGKIRAADIRNNQGASGRMN